jgi:hypothetical protein
MSRRCARPSSDAGATAEPRGIAASPIRSAGKGGREGAEQGGLGSTAVRPWAPLTSRTRSTNAPLVAPVRLQARIMSPLPRLPGVQRRPDNLMRLCAGALRWGPQVRRALQGPAPHHQRSSIVARGGDSRGTISTALGLQAAESPPPPCCEGCCQERSACRRRRRRGSRPAERVGGAKQA